MAVIEISSLKATQIECTSSPTYESVEIVKETAQNFLSGRFKTNQT